MKKTLADLFNKTPHQWGVRGDPHLWQEMHDLFIETPIPATADKLVTLLEEAFENLTKHPITTTEEYIYIERFNHGGMSGGLVSSKFWREKVIPLMRERFETADE